MSLRPVRVRFAPSPTGPLHIGGVRTALFNYLFARQTGGTMILRIEDTDQGRFVPGAEDYIRQALAWCGITLDESPWNGGPHAPYRQSERKEIYKQYALQLLEEGNAYYAFDTPEELEAMRERLKAAGVDQPQYNSISRLSMKNSLTLSADEVQARLASGQPYVIRVKIPAKEEVRLHDLVRGEVVVHSFTLDDKVLMKSDGMPTYHLANIVDDHLMQITHVIRGEEWLPSAPLHVLLYKFLGWADTMPQFAHLPLLLKPEGNGKLSKRDGDRLGFSTFPLLWTDPETGNISSGFREDGYLPDAFVNFLALLGWHSADDREIFSMDELIQTFSIERIGKAGVKFDIEKGKWFNQQYIKTKTADQLAQYLLADLQRRQVACTPEKAVKICELLRDRVTVLHDFAKDSAFLFAAPADYDMGVAEKKWNAEVETVLRAYQAVLPTLHTFDAAEAKHALEQVIEAQGLKLGKVMQGIRLAITGMGGGPDMMGILEILGAAEVSRRIDLAIAALGSKTA